MDRVGANAFLQTIRLYYPRAIFVKSEEEITARVDDYVKSFEKWDNELVLQALFDWHLEHNEAPTIADIIRECKVKEMESKPYDTLPKEEYVKRVENPWKRATERMRRDNSANRSNPHNFLYYVLVEYGYQEYLRAKELQINCKNRRNEENRMLGIDEVDNRVCEAKFASDEEKEQIRQLIREGKL